MRYTATITVNYDNNTEEDYRYSGHTWNDMAFIMKGWADRQGVSSIVIALTKETS